jgi:small subunit ribosomal protein S4
MIRKKKNYVRPKQIFQAERIKEEDALVEIYGLKNKTEIWKAQAKVNYFRGRAKELAKKPHEEQEIFFNKLRALGLKIEGTADVLDLKVEDILKRRLPTIVVLQKLAHTPKEARQLVSHNKILIDGIAMSSPSYLVSIGEQDKITVKKKEKKIKPKPTEKAETPKEALEKPKEDSNVETKE